MALKSLTKLRIMTRREGLAFRGNSNEIHRQLIPDFPISSRTPWAFEQVSYTRNMSDIDTIMPELTHYTSKDFYAKQRSFVSGMISRGEVRRGSVNVY
jgi:hypothetical protein